MKKGLDYALQTMKAVTAMIEEELLEFLHEAEALCGEKGFQLKGMRAAHAGDSQTPIVYVRLEGPTDKKELLARLDQALRERIGVGVRSERGEEL